jgi:hypothetical protein
MGRLIIMFLCLATPALAQDRMTADEFAVYVEGKTLTFGSPVDDFYGVERYHDDRKVTWQADGGDCIEGEWFEVDGDICFLYENDPEPKCWAVYRTDTGIRAEFTTRPGTTLFEARENPEPLICPGPDLIG